MLFHSWQYAALLSGTLLLAALVPRDRRWLVLLLASGCFYAAWRIEYFALLLVTAASCYLAARKIQTTASSSVRRWWLGATIAVNLAILGLFKYYGLLAGTLAWWTQIPIPLDLGLLLPVGISFYTFQSIGYVVDAYRGRVLAEQSLARTVLFVSFFPQLVAGPIERAGHLMPALRRPIALRWHNLRRGGWLFLWGLFKKVVLADRCSMLVDACFAHPADQHGMLLWLAVYAFWLQIYCDFSGYTDMARGSARMFGIDLMQNFRVPYAATSLHDFWSRWHISLSTWFRDYVYIPLGGNRVSSWRWGWNILVVFALSGLWHGAAWSFLVWGLLHGMALIGEVAVVSTWHKFRVTPWLPVPVRRSLAWCWAFHCVALGWVFFRAETIGDAWITLQTIWRDWGAIDFTLPAEFSRFEAAIVVGATTWMLLVELPLQGRIDRVVLVRPRWISCLLIVVTLLWVLNFGIFGHPKEFVYFQF